MAATPEEQRAEEEQAIEDERQAFERRRRAFLAVQSQFSPRGNGMPRDDDLRELEEADADWKVKSAVVDRITDEILLWKTSISGRPRLSATAYRVRQSKITAPEQSGSGQSSRNRRTRIGRAVCAEDGIRFAEITVNT
ncbi:MULTISPECIES: hypothetical protein [Burkholderia]|uniref:hypothetical protein n=1 Tax=Burkholderia TaxID=32008 RepID=UPI00114CC7C5|nr:MULTISPECIES: hypothetical protein [Burkholderia]MBJ9681535.1 hypothetical protein [Burkholderia multivorans]